MNTLTHLTRPVFNWLLQTTWEAAVLAVLILLAQLAFRKKLPPNWRYGLWLLLVARLLMPALPPSTFSIFNLARMDVLHRASFVRPATSLENAAPATFPAGAPSIAPEPASRAAAPPMSPSVSDAAARLAVSTPRALSGSETWFAVAGGIWLGGACLLGLRLLLANLRFRSHVRCFVPVKDERITRLLADCAALLGVRRQVTLIETEEADSPAVWGLWHRRMLLPEGVFARFTPAELRHVFLHELAHLKRHDLEVSWLVAFLQILHWFNPVLWLAFTRMRADRELAVDALVLTHTREGGGVCYGETILKVLEGFKRQTVLPGLVGIGESKARIKERLEAMSRREVAKSWRWAAVGIALGLGGLALTDAVETNKPAPTKTKDPNPPAQCRATAELRDGSRVVGQFAQETIPLQSDLLGEFTLPVSRIRSIQWPHKNRPEARLKAINGDELQVKVRAPELRLQTQFGEVKLAPALLKQVQFSAVGAPADLRRGLLALWSAEDNARDSVKGHDGEMRFGADFAPGKVGRAFHFAANSARVHIEDTKDFLINGSFTLAGRVYVDEFPGPGGAGAICLRGDNRPGLDTWSISTQPDERIGFGIDSEDNQATSVTAPAKQGKWFQVAGVYDEEGSRLALYLDGQLAAEENNPVKPIWQLDPANEPGIGLGNTEGTFHVFPFRGSIDEWAIYARALSESEIQALVDLGNAGERLLPAK